jgi:glutamyl/glutaminyl-tRNA synthetase
MQPHEKRERERNDDEEEEEEEEEEETVVRMKLPGSDSTSLMNSLVMRAQVSAFLWLCVCVRARVCEGARALLENALMEN